MPRDSLGGDSSEGGWGWSIMCRETSAEMLGLSLWEERGKKIWIEKTHWACILPKSQVLWPGQLGVPKQHWRSHLGGVIVFKYFSVPVIDQEKWALVWFSNSIQENENGSWACHPWYSHRSSYRERVCPGTLWLSPGYCKKSVCFTSEEVLVVIGSVTVIITIVIKWRNLKEIMFFRNKCIHLE